ncbi:hypothetical protein PHMEG_00031410 [Phytophthora megakarya]|uniref:Uncharacterized protein n=1 Tax=Phytophthora megakarya TaxID=4795 RepID=A0A225UY91_9STRA|nr:hypothetical protein PHMEG_00031410 [Phytophthora megakarya]
MTKLHSLAYSAEYQYGENNILTTMHQEETRLRNERRVKCAQSVLDTEAGDRTVNNAKRIQQEQDREMEIDRQNERLLQRLERIHKKLPKQFDVSHRTEERLGPSNYPQWQREQERIADENRKMKRRINQTKSLLDTKQLAADAAKSRYFSDQLSKVDRRMHVKQKCKQLKLQSKAKRMDSDKSYELPRIRSHKVEHKYATSQESFPTVTNTSKVIRASDLLPRLGH